MSNEWVRIQGFSMKTHGNNSGGSKKLCGMIWNWWNWWDFVIPKIYMYTWKEVHLCDPYIYVFSYMYTCLLTTERAKFYTLGSKNRFLYPYFNYFSFIYLLYKCVSTRILLCVRKMEGDLWVSGPTFHSIGSKDQTPVIRFGRKWFQPLSWLSLLLPQVWISNINPPKKGIMPFQSCLNATEWKCLDSKALGRVIRNWI